MTRAGILAIAFLAACGGRSGPPPDEPAPAPPPGPPTVLAVLGSDSGDATAAVLAGAETDLDPADQPSEPYEIVFDLSTTEPTGAPDWLLAPVGARRTKLRACRPEDTTRTVFRATLVLDDAGRITEVVGGDPSDTGILCLVRALRAIRFHLPADHAPHEVYIRLELDR